MEHELRCSAVHPHHVEIVVLPAANICCYQYYMAFSHFTIQHYTIIRPTTIEATVEIQILTVKEESLNGGRYFISLELLTSQKKCTSA